MTTTRETVTSDIYDYPQYYDLVYGSDWKAEFDFLLECFERYAIGKVQNLFEPACGTGRLLIKLAQEGFMVAGNDLNEKSIRYCNQRLERHGFPPSAVVGDMSDFVLDEKVDAAFNMINSFRHLMSEELAENQLRCVAQSLRPGGLYVLGFFLTLTEGEMQERESWSARRGHLAVTSHLWTIQRDLQQRIERVGMAYDVYTPTRQFRLESEIDFRTYTAKQFLALVDRIPKLEIAAVHDFAYDVEQDIELTPQTEDVVFVLRKC